MTGRNRMQHLTDAEFADLLAGCEPGPAAEAHLATCEHCRGEMEFVHGSLMEFRIMGTAWAQAHAPKRVPVPSRLALRLGVQPSWGAGVAALATAALLVVGLDLPANHVRPTTAAVHVAPAVPSNAELAEDNRLMLSIDQELSYQAQSNFAADALRSAQPHAAHALVTPVAD